MREYACARGTKLHIARHMALSDKAEYQITEGRINGTVAVLYFLKEYITLTKVKIE
jgi:hypothetical protein